MRNIFVHSIFKDRKRGGEAQVLIQRIKRVCLEDKIQARFGQIEGLKKYKPIEASHMDLGINCMTSWGGRNDMLEILTLFIYLIYLITL